ncbi:hypothetical protein [Aquipuribacter sp. SD81]|uniref:hypothetical protein n=1 Tax=Aquipuribacter sp. SD81 TaxID=3127703 RepID=UPI003018FBCB
MTTPPYAAGPDTESRPGEQVPAPASVPPTLLRDWVVCGLVAATARFVPLPVLDDALAARAVRESVRRTLRASGRTYPFERVEDLVDRPGSLLGAVAGLPAKVLLWPARKWVRLVGAVRGVPADLTRVLALSRTTHRVLQRGGLADDADPAGLRREARAVRRAVDAVLDELDLRLVQAVLRDAVGGARGLSGALVDYARERFDRDRGDGGLEPGGDVDAGVDRVLAALRQPEVRRLVAELDRRVDERLEGTAA